MGRLEVFTVCLIFAITLNSAESKVIDSNNDDILIDAIFEDLATSLSENQEIKKLYPLIQEQLSDNKLQITYRLGSRVNGDRLIATATGNEAWNQAQDIKLGLNYPLLNVAGSVVTYVQVVVEQSTNIGQGYVTSGGIGQRQVSVVIEGNQTLYFKYNAEFFGY